MAATIEEIMDAVEVPLETLPNLRVREFAEDLPVTGNASVAIILTPPVESYRATMGRGRYQLSIEVVVLVSAAMSRVGQRKLAAFANQTGDSSVRQAVEADRTLGGIVDDCIVDSFRPLGLTEVGELGYYGGIFTLAVIARGV